MLPFGSHSGPAVESIAATGSRVSGSGVSSNGRRCDHARRLQGACVAGVVGLVSGVGSGFRFWGVRVRVLGVRSRGNIY